MSITKVCCTCLSFDVEMLSLANDRIRECLENVANIRIKLENELMQNVCTECVLMMKKFVEFKDRCLEANLILRQILSHNTHITKDLLKEGNLKLYSGTNIDFDNIPIISDANIVKCEEFADDSVSNSDSKNMLYNFETDTDIKNDSYKDDPNLIFSPDHVETNQYNSDIHDDVSSLKSELNESNEIEDETLQTYEYMNSPEKISQINNFRSKDNLLLKGETAFAVKVALTKEQQVEEFLKRGNSENYLNANFKCTHCLTGFISSEKLEQHMELHDESCVALQCDVCKLRYSTSTRLQQHQATHKFRYKCLTCGEVTDSQLLAKRHKNLHVDSLPYNTCKICMNPFQYKELYKRHICTAHPTDYVCDLCGDYFTSQFYLENHQKQATDCRKPPINIIECKRCDAYFLSVNTWYTHMLAHSDESDQIPPTECQICGHETTTWMDWRWHVSSEHCNKNIDEEKNMQRKAVKVECNECGKTLRSKNTLTKHIHMKHAHTVMSVNSLKKKIHTRKCEVCYKTLLKHNMRRHMIIHTGEKPYKCDKCGKCYSQAVSRDEHIKTVHKKSKRRNIQQLNSAIFECESCSKKYTSKTGLRTHLRIHTGEKPFLCNVCQKSFITKVQLELHQSKIHTGKKTKCDLCDREFSDKRYFRIHRKIHTGEKPFACDICDMRFLHRGNIKRHKLVHTGEKPFLCNVCHKSFTTKEQLEVHKSKIHTGKKTKCDLCDKEFFDKQYLRIHRKIHTGEKPFACDICDMRFLHSSYMRRHKLVHAGEKPFLCNVCHKSFITKVQLEVHQSKIHTGKKTKCDLCDKEFADKRYFRIHRKIHTGEKPFACDICDMRFFYPSNMKRHKLVHTGAKDFACELCGKTFARKSSMSDHIKAVHLKLPPRPRPRKPRKKS